MRDFVVRCLPATPMTEAEMLAQCALVGEIAEIQEEMEMIDNGWTPSAPVKPFVDEENW